jgi:hypothetical protein
MVLCRLWYQGENSWCQSDIWFCSSRKFIKLLPIIFGKQVILLSSAKAFARKMAVSCANKKITKLSKTGSALSTSAFGTSHIRNRTQRRRFFLSPGRFLNGKFKLRKEEDTKNETFLLWFSRSSSTPFSSKSWPVVWLTYLILRLNFPEEDSIDMTLTKTCNVIHSGWSQDYCTKTLNTLSPTEMTSDGLKFLSWLFLNIWLTWTLRKKNNGHTILRFQAAWFTVHLGRG